MTTIRLTVPVADERVRSLLTEFQLALSRMDRREVLMLVTVAPAKDFVDAVLRRGINLAKLVEVAATHSHSAVQAAVLAWTEDRLGEHFVDKANSGREWVEKAVDRSKKFANVVSADPVAEGTKLMAVALVALVSSGGLDGNGGLPDLDIPLMGIGAHRSPVTHSILIGAGAETLIALLIRLTLAIHSKLPPRHDPVWDEFHSHSTELLDAVSRGISLGVAYHFLVDGLLQPGTYHDLPFHAPLEVQQAIQVANGLAEGLDGVTRAMIQAKTAGLVASHREVLKLPFDVDPCLIEWLGPQKTELLERRGTWLCALSNGTLAPFTPEQVNFVLVARQLSVANTPDEVAWVWFINLMRIAKSMERAGKTSLSSIWSTRHNRFS